MKEWRYTFDAVSKPEWLAQIKKDLKEASFDSLRTEWWEGEFIEPFHHNEDVAEKVILPDEYFTDPPMLMEWINTTKKEHTQITRQIKNSLQYGAQSIVFENKKDSVADWNIWLEGVHKDMVDLNLDISPANENLSSILQTLPSLMGLRLYRDHNSTPELLNHFLSVKNTDHPIQFIYRIPSGKNWLNDAVEMFNSIIRDFKYVSEKTHDDDFLGNCRIVIDAEASFLKQVIQLRVIQLVWLNLNARAREQSQIVVSPIEYHINGRETTNPDQFLIHASASSLASSLTGVFAICIHHLPADNIQSYYERINRNIHHLLALESQVYKGRDPLCGSYTIDFYTAKWTQVILGKLSASK